MGRFKAKSEYEELRQTRIFENQARLASLGLKKTLSELRSLTSALRSDETPVKKHCKIDYSASPLRRSARLRKRLPPSEGTAIAHFVGKGKRGLRQWKISEEELSRRCESNAGEVFYPVYGIRCHSCQKEEMCGEEDCKRCGELNMDQPCIGKTDCSICHSSNGIFCRNCLKLRYGEELDEVRSNKEWMCPHCAEDKGTKPYWICNSSICLKKRKMEPTGATPITVREMGYKSVAHLLMAELERADKKYG